jgi:Tol biopolymer transport system component
VTNQKHAFATNSLLSIGLCLSLCLLMGCSAVPSLFPAQPPITPTVHVPQVHNGLIAFTVRDADFRGRIYTMNPDGTNRQPLFETSEYASSPVWSPDGKRLLFSSSECLQVMSFETKDKECIPFDIETVGFTDGYQTQTGLVWSPDGSKLLFQASAGYFSGVYVMNADGSDLKQVPPSKLVAIWPSWSPDSQQIAFGTVAAYAGSIHVVDADGSNVRSLSDEVQGASYSSWSRDGKHIFFQGGDPVYSSTYIAYVMDSDGSNLQPLLKLPESRQNVLKGVSPDGSKVLLTARIWEKENQREMPYVVVLDAYDYSVIHMFPKFISEDVMWSPDSQQISYRSGDAYGFMNLDGSGEYTLDIPWQNGRMIAWQPVWR